MSRPGDRFSTVTAERGSPLASIKEKFTELEAHVVDVLDPNHPAVAAGLQRLEIALHVFAGVPEAHEVPQGEKAATAKRPRAKAAPKAKPKDEGESDGDGEPETE